jgi:HTH-type transcriptional regulator/antitoxin HigA
MREISQKELSIRTGFSEKHISTVIHGTKDISSLFAYRLGVALDTPASFWKNLQNQYDLESESLKERHEITEDEINIAQSLIKPLSKISEIELSSSDSQNVINLRKGLGVHSLLSIPFLKKSNPAYYRAQFKEGVSDYILYAWQYLIERNIDKQTDDPFDYDLLIDSLPQIKNVMFKNPDDHFMEIQTLLNRCGVLFTIQKPFKEAPLNGLTAKTSGNRILISLTLKGKYIDIIFFTLFHEIAHILNKDYLVYDKEGLTPNEIESRANRFAEDFLIDPIKYKEFIENQKFDDASIIEFSKEVNIIPSILIGRLMNDHHISWKEHPLRIKYDSFTES